MRIVCLKYAVFKIRFSRKPYFATSRWNAPMWYTRRNKESSFQLQLLNCFFFKKLHVFWQKNSCFFLRFPSKSQKYFKTSENHNFKDCVLKTLAWINLICVNTDSGFKVVGSQAKCIVQTMEGDVRIESTCSAIVMRPSVLHADMRMPLALFPLKSEHVAQKVHWYF